MKISKIVSAAILSIAVSGSAFGDGQSKNNDALSSIIGKNGLEIKANDITQDNINKVKKIAENKKIELKLAKEKLAAIKAGEEATKEKIEALEDKVAEVVESVLAAKEVAKAAIIIALDERDKPNATPEQKVAAEAKIEEARKVVEYTDELLAEAEAEVYIAKEAAVEAKAAVLEGATEAIKKAKENIETKSKELNALQDALAETNVNTAKANAELAKKQKALEEAQEAYESATEAQKAEKLKALNDARNAVAEAKKEVGAANADRAIRAVRKLDSISKNVAESLGDISADNKVLSKLFSEGVKKEDIVKVVENVTSSVTTSVDSMAKISNVDIIKFNTDLSTATRLASLSNPFNADLALASAIKYLKDDSFASSDDSALSSTVREYTDRFNYDNNLWGSVLGGKTSAKNGANPKIFGVTLGYDKRFDNMIVGATTTYTQTKADKSDVELKGKNIQLGLYTRGYFDENEVDARINFNFGDNKVKRTTSIGKTDGKFDSFATSFDLTYGRIYQLDNDLMIKPLGGVGYTYLKTKSFAEKGEGALSYSSITTKVANLKAGVELRKYLESGEYFYVTPGVEREIFKNVKDPIVKFIGAENGIKLVGDDKKNTYFTLQTGANFNLTDSLSTNINFGTKLGSKNKFYNGTIGVNYKF
ncbi:autotransporter domain protein [Campylobacter pinnipediorum subsp. pinnipediorum]|uniref:autotransporter outer membrane beta-barrel domain-containing protein n=1 Tax=Campylobacter pinnipediorum TaxID=1965231 RepID=UPI0009951933|nr:autotransporter outer membrane beta-barrel domain-containing protein [Campylobacter pinnipediorum]AQW83774.1 autotransporter domain protein [Campylobacter pinnipediorum subsp. pinnipediorum]